MKHTETDWTPKQTSVFVVDGCEYEVEYHCFLETVEEPDFSGPVKVTTATLEGWSSLPHTEPNHPHYSKLETMLLNEIEEKYGD